MSESFLGRWSRRKLDVKQGKEVEPEHLPPPQPSPVGGESEDRQRVKEAALLPPPPGEGRGGGTASPPLTLDDVNLLTSESDFTRFASPDVAPEVKNAAMKKLFADPRFNVMDGMDVYIDDYSKPDPIPSAMLRQLAGAQFLGLLSGDEPGDAMDNPTAQSVAQSDSKPPAVPEAVDHAHPDLRLQQDHAAPGEDSGRGTG